MILEDVNLPSVLHTEKWGENNLPTVNKQFKIYFHVLIPK